MCTGLKCSVLTFVFDHTGNEWFGVVLCRTTRENLREIRIFMIIYHADKRSFLPGCSQESNQLVSIKYMTMNIISPTCTPYYPYTLYRESQALGQINKETICWSNNWPYKGLSWVSANSTKVTESPENFIEARQLRMSMISTLLPPVVGSNYWSSN